MAAASTSTAMNTSVAIKAFLIRAFSARWLLITNTVTGSTLLTTGDLIHQQMAHIAAGTPLKIDWKRTLRVASMGALLAPINHFYYKWLDTYVINGTRKAIVVKKLAIDTATGPFFAATYVTGLNVLEGNKMEDGLREYQQKFLQFLALDAFLWLPVQAINFWFIPLKYRILFVSTAALVDSVLFAHIKRGGLEDESESSAKHDNSAVKE